MVLTEARPMKRLIEAKELQAKLSKQLQCPSKAARVVSFWLYMTTFGPNTTRVVFGQSTYYRNVKELTIALTS